MALEKLLVSGACLRPNARELGDGKFYGRAVLQQLDLASGEYSLVRKTVQDTARRNAAPPR